jgi:hypothetical protein
MIKKNINYLLLAFLMSSSCTDNEKRNQSTISSEKYYDSLLSANILIPPLFEEQLFDSLLVDKYYRLARETEGELRLIYSANQLSGEIIELISSDLKPKTDLLFLVDRTGSMLDDIINVKSGINKIIESIKMFEDVRVGISLYGDSRFDGTSWFEYQNFETDLDSFQKYVRKVRVVDGGDTPESVYEAFFEFDKKRFWRSNSKRAIILIGDAPPIEKPQSEYSVMDLIKASKRDTVNMNFYPILIAPNKAIQNSTDSIFFSQIKLTNKVYPIPTNEKVTLEMKVDGNYTVEVFNRGSELLDVQKLVGLNFEVSLSEFPSGLYMLRVQNDKKEFETIKVIKD